MCSVDGHRPRVGGGFLRRDRGRKRGPACIGQLHCDDPDPLRLHPDSASSARHGTPFTRNMSARKDLNDQKLIYGAINGMTQAVGDTGHTSFLTPEERAARASGLSGSYVGIGVRIDAADRRPAGRHRRVQGQPGREGGPQGRRGDRLRRRQHDDRSKPRRGLRLGPRRGWIDRPRDAPRRHHGTTRDLSMVRADVAVVPVTWALVPGTRTALIRLEQFSHNSTGASRTRSTPPERQAPSG